MHPRRRWIESTAFGPNLVRSLLPPTVVDSVLSALPFGNHCELARFDQANGDGQSLRITMSLSICRTCDGPNRFATSPRRTSSAKMDGMVAEDVESNATRRSISLQQPRHSLVPSAPHGAWQIQNCDDSFHFQSTFLNPCLRSAALKNTGRCRL